jgi:aspartate/methionine/tyrosine aminotransferase
VAVLKLDGATKEYYAWGLRIGFISLAAKGLLAEHFAAFDEKARAAVRTSVSSASRLSQSLLIRLLESTTSPAEKRKAFDMLMRRYRTVKEILSKHSSPLLEPLPFNSGYFITFRTTKIDAQALRSSLLTAEGIGTVALSAGLLRVTYASVDEERLLDLFTEIFRAAEALGNKKERSKKS